MFLLFLRYQFFVTFQLLKVVVLEFMDLLLWFDFVKGASV